MNTFAKARDNFYFRSFFNIKSVGILLILLFTLSCSESFSRENRLNHFYQLLDAKTISSFEQGDIKVVADYLRQRQSDPEFTEKYHALKEREAIDLFNDTQTVEFFYNYFYKVKD